DDGARRFRHAVGELLDGDEFRDRDLADELVLGLARVEVLHAPLGAAHERGFRMLAHLVGLQSGHQGEAGAALLATTGSRCLGRSGGPCGTAGTARAWRFILLSLGNLGAGERSNRELGLDLFLAAEPLLGFLLGLALAFLVMPTAIV